MPTLSGISLALLALFSLGLGLSFFWAPLLWICMLGYFLTLCIAAIDYVISGNASDIKINRELNAKFSLSDPNEVFLHIENRSERSIKTKISDNVPEYFQRRDIQYVLKLEPGQKVIQSYSLVPYERGEFNFETVSLRIFGKLGFIRKTHHIPLPAQIKVYPSYLQIRKYQLHARRTNFEMAGRKKQKRYGEGREFESLREYTKNDEYKKINWKATARRGKPIVSQFRIERNQNVIILMDAGRMMRTLSGEMTKLDYSVNASLMLSYLSIHREDNVGLMVFNSTIRDFLPPKRGVQQLNLINETLYNVQMAFEEPDYRKAFQFIKRKVNKRSLIVLITDLMDRRSSQILIREFTALYPRHLPLCITLKDKRVEDAAFGIPESREQAAELAIAQDLVEERYRAHRFLQQRGVLTIDTMPEHLTVNAINKYIEIKAKSMI